MRRPGVVVLISLLVGLAAPALPARAVPFNPTVYAHRGGAGYAPENTMGAFRKTEGLYGERGVWLEMDTQASKDGALVIMHDDTVDRTTNCHGDVNALTLAQLTACNAASHFAGWPTAEPVPTLLEVLREARVNGWKLMVEIKDIPGESNFDATGAKVAAQLVQLVHAENFPVTHLLIQSFWPAALDNIRRLDKRIGRVLLTSSTLPGAPVGIPALGNLAYDTIANHQIAAPDIASIGMNKQFVTIAHRLGKKVVPWTVDDQLTMGDLRAWGADGIITNRPDRAFALYS
jgi:glycerophosphoryl diester phosphodiesterase